MRLITLTIFCLLVSACSNPSISNQASDDPLNADAVAVHNASVSNEKDKIICKKVKETGSYIPTKRCRTVRQLEAEQEAANRGIDKMRSGSNSPNVN